MPGFNEARVRKFFKQVLGRNFLKIMFDEIDSTLTIEFEAFNDVIDFSLKRYLMVQKVFGAEDVLGTVKLMEYPKTSRHSATRCKRVIISVLKVSSWPE
ncbi:TPA: hypothetical protein DF272_06205 [Candidatus Falkowbacteria bacterium]|nr:hypothetical protein [Candidatus Falkowbacteria bacterium]